MDVPGLAALNTGGDAAVASVSCASPGNCAAVGGYRNGTTKTGQPFVVSETNGAWGQAREVPGIGSLDSGGTAEIASVSCGAPGDCAAGGFYADPAGYIHAYVVSETAGTWGDAIPVRGSIIVAPDPNSHVTSVSCASAGNCSAVGYYGTGSTVSTRVIDPFAVNETDGIWGTAQPITGLSSLNPVKTVPASVSCASAGNCSAGGLAEGGSQIQAWVVSETDGSWGAAEEVPGVAGLSATPNSRTTSVSCPAAGDCSATGWYTGKPAAVAFIANETNGMWGAAQPVPAPNAGQGMVPASLSCASPGNCSISRNYHDTSDNSLQAFVAGEVQGTVAAAEEMPGTAALNAGGNATARSVSCAPSGYCAAVGWYTGAGQSGGHAYVATESGGTWGMAQEISGLQTLENSSGAGLDSVSCAATGYCSAGGSYVDQAGKGQAFVVGEATAATVTLRASAPTLIYGDGHEQAETLTATVTSSAGGTPTGTVTVTDGSTAVCTITLVNGTGSCPLAARALPIGTDQLTASYSGDPSYVAASSAVTVQVITLRSVRGLGVGPSVLPFRPSVRLAEELGSTAWVKRILPVRLAGR